MQASATRGQREIPVQPGPRGPQVPLGLQLTLQSARMLAAFLEPVDQLQPQILCASGEHQDPKDSPLVEFPSLYKGKKLMKQMRCDLLFCHTTVAFFL